jgi:DUF1680 family protein
VYVHLYDNSTLDWHLDNGTALKIEQKTNYPWDGDVKMTVTPAQSAEFTMFVRIPGWVKGAKAAVNGKRVEGAQAGQYLAIMRKWSPGDTLSLTFPMPTEAVASNPRVIENRGRVAVQRGPIVYCLEQLDQPNMPALADVALVANQPADKAFHAEHKADLLGGVTVLHHNGLAREASSSNEPLYMAPGADSAKAHAQDLTLIPYYAWANRKPTQMQVWATYSRT